MDGDNQTMLMEDSYVALVLVLAGQIKEEKRRNGVRSTSDFTYEAANLIHQKRGDILQNRQSSR